ncbi:MAG: DedA family protein [Patescibacteria group bacterium]|nr:DedA family protein [Patescibacteria group bacterium]
MADFLLQYITHLVATMGYGGITVLMAMESMILPVPSEAVMPLAGFLWFSHQMSFWAIVLFSTLGTIIGAGISYVMGFYGGRPLVQKYGKYFLLNNHHLEVTEKFFAKHGEKAIFFSRFIPVVRHLISIPAGVGKMKIWKFCVYTLVGGAIWNSILTITGYLLGSRWTEIRKFGEVIDIILIILIIAAIIYLIYRKKHKKIINV